MYIFLSKKRRCFAGPPGWLFFTRPGDQRSLLFAPRSQLALIAPFQGAKSSHSRRPFLPARATGGPFSLLPAPSQPLFLRFGEQNLHITAGPFYPPRRPVASSLCSPFHANPCSFVPGSKIFTFPPPDFVRSGARRPPLFAPRSPLAFAAPFRGAKSSHYRQPFSHARVTGGPFSLLPAPR